MRLLTKLTNFKALADELTNRSLVVVVSAVLLTLLAHGKCIHVGLADADCLFVSLKTREESLTEVEAWVLLGSFLCLLLLFVSSFGSVLLLLLWCLTLVRVLLLTSISMSRTTAHHRVNCLVSDCTTGSESHTCCHCAHETTASHAHTL